MKKLIIVLLLIQGISGFSQAELRLFTGDFNQAIDSAQKLNKNIFLITRSYKCHVFKKFKEVLITDKESIDFLNTHFIVFEYDMDKASEEEKKRMKEYYHSWRGFPQIYFIDKNEKLISDIGYSLKIEHDQQLKIWKDYRNIENEWKKIKHLKNHRTIDYDDLNKYLCYRQIKYSSFDLIHIKNILDRYFKNLDPTEYLSEHNWLLIQNYVTMYSNPEIVDLVANNKSDFQKAFGDSNVCNYLSYNYQRYIDWRKPKKVDKIAGKYPYNSVPEAIQAIENYRRNKENSMFGTQF